MRRIMILCLLALSTCVSPRTIPGHVTYLSDGSPAYAITCDSPFSDEAECLTRAGQICAETGYAVVSRANEPLSFKRSMTIRCKTASGLYPADEAHPPL